MDLRAIAEAYQNVYEKKLDPVGKEDGDVNNDGKKDSTDSYLMNRRNAIEKSMKEKGKAMKKSDDKKDKMEEVQQVDEVVGALVGGAVGSKVLPGLIGKAAPGFAATGIGKALTSKAAGAAIGAGAGEMLDPFKKGKDKKPLQAAIGGGIAGAAASKVADLADKIPARTPAKPTPDTGLDKPGIMDKAKTTPGTDPKKIKNKPLKVEHHQKDADGKVIEHDDTTPSSVEELTVLEQLAENGREIDAFEAVISYLIDEGFAKSWEEAQDIMVTLKPELVEEVYQNQLQKLEESKTKAAVGGMLGNVGGRAIGSAIGGAIGGPAGAKAGSTIGKFAGAALGSAATAKKGRKKSAAIGAALGSAPEMGMGVGLGSGIGGAIGG